MELRKFILPEIVEGEGSRFLLSRYLINYSVSNVLLVTDPGIIAAGWIQPMIDHILESGISVHVFSKITPNPRDFEVMEGAIFFADNACDGIVAIGGGSPMDCAKAIGIVVSNSADISEYFGVDLIRKPLPPMFFIPTTAGTASEISQFAIIKDSKINLKKASISKVLIPDLALIDAELTTTMDPYLTVCTGIDALSHAFEAFVSNAGTDLTRILALNAAQKIVNNITESVKNPHNITARTNMLNGSMMAGMAFSNVSLGMVHAMAHSLGGVLDVPHGECNAILLDKVIRYNGNVYPEVYFPLADSLLGKDYPKHSKLDYLIGFINELKGSLNIPENYSLITIDSIEKEKIIKSSLSDPCLLTNPVMPDEKDINSILDKIF